MIPVSSLEIDWFSYTGLLWKGFDGTCSFFFSKSDVALMFADYGIRRMMTLLFLMYHLQSFCKNFIRCVTKIAI